MDQFARGIGRILHPSKHRVCAYPTATGGWTWMIKSALPSTRVLAASSGQEYTRASDALRAAEIFYKAHSVDFLLAERQVDFSHQPCTPQPSST